MDTRKRSDSGGSRCPEFPNEKPMSTELLSPVFPSPRAPSRSRSPLSERCGSAPASPYLPDMNSSTLCCPSRLRRSHAAAFVRVRDSFCDIWSGAVLPSKGWLRALLPVTLGRTGQALENENVSASARAGMLRTAFIRHSAFWANARTDSGASLVTGGPQPFYYPPRPFGRLGSLT